jgi:fucose 4-O-acetylase-like acetyltransferase
MRGIAMLLLVSDHVIGSDPKAGLELDYPHPLRLYADTLIHVRMPLFAFIAGYVFGLKPLTADRYAEFMQGKFRRLFIPGSISPCHVFWFVALVHRQAREEY